MDMIAFFTYLKVCQLEGNIHWFSIAPESKIRYSGCKLQKRIFRLELERNSKQSSLTMKPVTEKSDGFSLAESL